MRLLSVSNLDSSVTLSKWETLTCFDRLWLKGINNLLWLFSGNIQNKINIIGHINLFCQRCPQFQEKMVDIWVPQAIELDPSLWCSWSKHNILKALFRSKSDPLCWGRQCPTCNPGDGDLSTAAPLAPLADWLDLDHIVLVHGQWELQGCAVGLHHTGPGLPVLLVHHLQGGGSQSVSQCAEMEWGRRGRGSH